MIFKSDNGGYHGDNSPLRGFKGTLYEGGLSAGAMYLRTDEHLYKIAR